MLLVWHRANCWAYLYGLMGVISEFGQLVDAVPGTFDPLDIVAYLLGALIPFWWFQDESTQIGFRSAIYGHPRSGIGRE